MKLSELKIIIDSLMNEENREKSVVITLSQPSYGTRACSGIKNIYEGIDWEHNQIRIEPDKKICEQGKSKDDIAEIEIFSFSSPRTFYACPMCKNLVEKEDCYCPSCGQHLTFNKNKEPADSYKKEI